MNLNDYRAAMFLNRAIILLCKIDNSRIISMRTEIQKRKKIYRQYIIYSVIITVTYYPIHYSQ